MTDDTDGGERRRRDLGAALGALGCLLAVLVAGAVLPAYGGVSEAFDGPGADDALETSIPDGADASGSTGEGAQSGDDGGASGGGEAGEADGGEGDRGEGTGGGGGEGTGSDGSPGSGESSSSGEGSSSGGSSGPGAGGNGGGGSGGELAEPGAEPPYRILVRPDPVPGRRVLITVSKGSVLAEDVPIYVNGDRIGRTNASGQVAVTVPYEREFDVVAEPPEPGPRQARLDAPAGGAASLSASAVRDDSPAGRQRFFALRAPPIAPSDLSATPTNAGATRPQTADPEPTPTENVSASKPLSTAISIATDRTPRPGERFRAAASIRGVPVGDATVYLDGAQAGRTDSEGYAYLRAPDNDSANVTIVRGSARGTKNVSIAAPDPEAGLADVETESDLSVEVDPWPWPATVPGVPHRVRVRDEMGMPVANATVELGEQTRTTGEWGEATVRPPAKLRASVVVTARGTTATHPLSPLTAPLAATLSLVGLVVGAAALRRTRGDVRSALARTIHLAVTVLLALATRGQSLLGWLRALAVRAGERLRQIAASLAARDPRAALEAVFRAVRAAIERARARIRRVSTRAALARLVASTPLSAAERGGAATGKVPESTERRRTPDERVRGAWREMGRLAVGYRLRTTTPGSVRNAAVASGYPAEAVGALTGLFERLEYGGRAPTPTEAERAEAALQSVRNAHQRTADGGEDGDGKDDGMDEDGMNEDGKDHDGKDSGGTDDGGRAADATSGPPGRSDRPNGGETR